MYNLIQAVQKDGKKETLIKEFVLDVNEYPSGLIDVNINGKWYETEKFELCHLYNVDFSSGKVLNELIVK